eukprot:TRINITY_DN10640_c0_g1_i2.p1 TRINITY_DN10640_c0_g1~~TRINITY_DN10640_c0_g1_i2.p1  ORF type:complete len:232 (+),score=39.13 TRINITY_DN10640_c0_g1_i2:74-769(+)
MNFGHDEQSFSDSPSELQTSHLSHASFYSSFGTVDTETPSWLRDSSAYSSFSVEEPQRVETIRDLGAHLDRLRARALESSFSWQAESERVRRPFPASRNSSFSSRNSSSFRSSFGSCDVHEPSFHGSFLNDGDDDNTLKHHCLSIPEHPYDVPTADTLPHQNECVKCDRQGADLDDLDFGDEYLADDWPTRDAKVRFHASGQDSQGLDHRRDSVLSSGLQSAEQAEVKVVV